MKIPKEKRLRSGGYVIYLRLNGKEISVKGNTAKECRNNAAKIKADYLTGNKKRPTADITLREACERQINRREKQMRSPETIRGYDVILRCRFQSAMNKPVSQIKNWQELYDKDASHLSQKTMKNTWSFIRGAVRDQCGLSIDIEIPENKKPAEHPFLEPEQIPVFVQDAKDDPCGIAMLLGLSSLRASEMRALEWDDIDLKNKRIHVSGSVVKDKNGNYIEKAENKTEASTRYVPIFIPELYDLLSQGGEGKVVRNGANTIRTHVNLICKRNGFPEVGTHGLRHSFASLCYSLGIPARVTMSVGGWGDYSTVMRIYTHLSQRDIGKHTDVLEAFFSK